MSKLLLRLLSDKKILDALSTREAFCRRYEEYLIELNRRGVLPLYGERITFFAYKFLDASQIQVVERFCGSPEGGGSELYCATAITGNLDALRYLVKKTKPSEDDLEKMLVVLANRRVHEGELRSFIDAISDRSGYFPWPRDLRRVMNFAVRSCCLSVIQTILQNVNIEKSMFTRLNYDYATIFVCQSQLFLDPPSRKSDDLRRIASRELTEIFNVFLSATEDAAGREALKESFMRGVVDSLRRMTADELGVRELRRIYRHLTESCACRSTKMYDYQDIGYSRSHDEVVNEWLAKHAR